MRSLKHRNLQMSLNDFKVIKKLGEGSYSSVLLVQRLSDGSEYALKQVKMEDLTEKEKENALNEVRILASIQHPNVVSYKEAFIDEPSNTLCLIMEYAENGDMYAEIVNYQRNGTLADEDWIWRIIIQMVRGLKALHTLKILHRDLKAANVFLTDEKQTAKLGDLNVSKVNKRGMLYTQTGTPYYASPEVWRDNPYDHKSDIWSMGCVIYEITTLKTPFRAENMEVLFKKVQAGKFARIPVDYSLDLGNLIRSCLQVQSHLRPDCDKILAMDCVYKKAIQFFPQSTGTNYDNILLRTIRVPKYLKYVTEQLPRSTYQASEGGSSLRIQVAKKRNTTNDYLDRKVFHKEKRHKSVGKQYLALYNSDHIQKQYKDIGRDIEDVEDKGHIISQIIQVKHEIDREQDRIAMPEKAPRSIDPILRKHRRRKAQLIDTHQEEPTNRIVMEEGIYEQDRKKEESEKISDYQAVLQRFNKKYQLQPPPKLEEQRQQSVIQNEGENFSRIMRKPSPSIMENAPPQQVYQFQLPTIDNQRNMGGQRSTTIDYQSKPSNPANMIPKYSERSIQSLAKPMIGVNADRFNVYSQREQSLQEQNRIKNIIAAQGINRIQQQLSYNNQSVQMKIPLIQQNQQQYNLYVNNIRPQQQSEFGLGHGNKVDYFNRLYPQF